MVKYKYAFDPLTRLLMEENNMKYFFSALFIITFIFIIVCIAFVLIQDRREYNNHNLIIGKIIKIKKKRNGNLALYISDGTCLERKYFYDNPYAKFKVGETYKFCVYKNKIENVL